MTATGDAGDGGLLGAGSASPSGGIAGADPAAARFTIDRGDVRRMVDMLGQLLIDEYVFPDVGEQLQALLAQRLDAGVYDGLTHVRAFADAVTSDLQEINGDRHLRLLFSEDEVVSEADAAEQFKAFTSCAEATAAGVARVERLEDNIGYLQLQPILFPPSIAGDEMSAAMTLVATADALIMDVRECLGGDPSMVMLICSYLFGDDPVHLIDIYERRGDLTNQHWTQPFVPGRKFGPDKPLYLLASRTTFSGAEDLCYDLQRLGRGLVVGEASGGGAHPREGFRLHPHLEATIPIARAVDPDTGGNWEGTGVTPDLSVPSDEALNAAIAHARQRIRL